MVDKSGKDAIGKAYTLLHGIAPPETGRLVFNKRVNAWFRKFDAPHNLNAWPVQWM